MQAVSGHITDIQTATRAIIEVCKQANQNSSALKDAETDLPTLEQAFDQLLDVMTRVESDTQSSSDTRSEDITEIGEYALQMQETLTTTVEKLGLTKQKQPLSYLTINIALWIAAHDGRIQTLEPVVDAIAQVANTTRDPQQLEQFDGVIKQIIRSVSSIISQDLEKMSPGRPWRVLLLNHGIVATRSHNTEAMEAAFSLLTSKLPEDATRFFSEGMQQMEALNYPSHVRKVMEKYHREWPINRSLH